MQPPKFLDNLWAPYSSLHPPPKLQRINCCHCAIQYSCVVKIMVSFPSPSCRFCRGSSSPCQYHARSWVAWVSLPWCSVWKMLPTENLIVDEAFTVICWGNFLLEWQPHLLCCSAVAVCILVLSASGAFVWLYRGNSSTQSGPLLDSFFDSMSLLQTDATGVVLNLYPK